jgi:hypothetical protein
VLPALEAIVASVEAASFEAGIYTSARYWPSMAGNSTAVARLPLWHADYRQRYAAASPPDFERDFAPYGGWKRPLVWQWAGSTDLCGLNVDMNASEVAIGRPAAPKEALMVRHNAAAFEGDALRGRTVVDVRQRFGIEAARMLRLDVMLAKPAYVGIGDGDGGPYAGSLREGDRHAVIDVLTPGAKLTVDAPDGAEFEFIGVLGYWE